MLSLEQQSLEEVDMLCRKPWRTGNIESRCGKCSACKLALRRLWTARLLLESFCSDVSFFVTLTFSSDGLSDAHDDCGDGEDFYKVVYQRFLKRLRAAVSPAKVRYYLAFEFGAQTCRPHYHVVLYFSGQVSVDLAHVWPYGFSKIDFLMPGNAAYIAGYTLKKFGSTVGEFRRMSLKPGIGGLAVDQFGEWLVSHVGADYISGNGDVISGFRFNGRIWSFGRYLRALLRESAGMTRQLSDVQMQRLQLQLRDDLVAAGRNVGKNFVRRAHDAAAGKVIELARARKEFRHETI